MKSQQHPWTCGAAVVRNALRAFGKKVSEGEVRIQAGTTRDYGTSEHGIMNALRAFDMDFEEAGFHMTGEAWFWLHEQFEKGRTVITCVENWEHWVLALGSAGDRIVIFDSSNWKYNIYENGTHLWDFDRMMFKWWNDRKSIEDGEKRIYAISTWPKENGARPGGIQSLQNSEAGFDTSAPRKESESDEC